MIVITGAAGFIGSCFLSRLNKESYRDIVIVDDFSRPAKLRNYEDKTFTEKVERNQFDKWLEKNQRWVQIIIHLGARTDTTETNSEIFDCLNLNYSKMIWHNCVKYGIPLMYASSAATYGDGSKGYSDAHQLIPELKALNPYGASKQAFDTWALQQGEKPFFWAGFKFFNVYGPNEYHKGRMASVVFHAWQQIQDTGKVNLFRSHKPDFADGEQQRDFIYIKDVCDILLYFMETRPKSGIFNLGTGKARSFNALAKACFKAIGAESKIEYIDTPEDIRDTYQYYTESQMSKLRKSGYKKEFTSLEDGIEDYVTNFLNPKRYL